MAKSKWRWEMLVPIYRMKRLGLEDVDICKELKISRPTFWRFKRDVPELKKAIELALKEKAENQDLPSWVNARLSQDLMELWKKIMKWDRSKEATAVQKIELLLQDHGRRVRQQLFLHALCVFHFSPSMALQKVNLTRKELQKWINEDVEFAELVEEVEWHKGNFFEQSLVQLVKEGNAAATIFANRSFNGVRGYNPRAQVDVNVNGQVMVGVVDMADLLPYLTDSARHEVLEAIRKKEVADNQPPTIVGRLAGEIAQAARE